MSDRDTRAQLRAIRVALGSLLFVVGLVVYGAGQAFALITVKPYYVQGVAALSAACYIAGGLAMFVGFVVVFSDELERLGAWLDERLARTRQRLAGGRDD